MSVAGIETRPVREREHRATPRLRPKSGVPAPSASGVVEAPQPRACRPAPPKVFAPGPAPMSAAPAAASPSSWRLTDRGIALVLVTAAMLAVAALAVVVPTAWQVTGQDYRPAGTSQVVLP